MGNKRNRSMRLDDAQLEKLKSMNVNISELVRELLDQWLEIKVCPVCNATLDRKHIDKKQ